MNHCQCGESISLFLTSLLGRLLFLPRLSRAALFFFSELQHWCCESCSFFFFCSLFHI
uniref:Uncharacterized protein n=1 Tax=Setaria italica TaxID=4555 RepID=K3ZP68_SETIT